MMKRTSYILLCILPCCVLSCQEKASPDATGAGVPIVLSAGIHSAEPETRTAYELNKPDTDNPLHAAVWLSTSGDFLNSNTGDGTSTLEAETTVFFQNEKDQLLKKNSDSELNIVYPSACVDASHKVYFIGLHPDASWGFTSGSTNSGTFRLYDGSEDLMFAPKVFGYIAVSPNPQLHFYHLLTYLRLEVKAENADVVSSWGKLQSVTLALQKQKLTLSDLTRVPDFTTVSFDEDVTLPFYATGENTSFAATYPSGYTLKTAFEEVAYVLCTPTTATIADGGGERTSEYSIFLDTERRTNVEVKVDLKTADGLADDSYFAGSTMGRMFVLKLTFTASGYVSASATISPWTTGGYISQDVER